MKVCAHCQQHNSDDANFCGQCGQVLASADSDTVAAAAPVAEEMPPAAQRVTAMPDEELWRQFIGPNAGKYLEQFKKFATADGQPRFAFSWNWPAFLFISFLWFLYRKMYLHAFVYAIGPITSSYLTGDMLVSMVWSVMAGATANYLYYWHCREEIAEIKKAGCMNPAAQDAALKEAGGVQPYVIYVGIALYILALAGLAKMVEEGMPEGGPGPTKPSKPVSTVSA